MPISLALGVPQSLNGEVSTPGTSAQIVVEVVLTLVSQNVATNESVVSWEFRLREYVNASPFNNNAGSVGNCTVNVPVFSASNLTYNFNLTNETIVYGSNTVTIAHNADGTKSFTASGSFSGQGGTPLGSGSFSDTVTLPTIPRATTPSLSTSTPDTGSAVNVTLTPADSGFSHRLYWAFQPGTGGTAIDNKIVGLAAGGGSASGSVEGDSADGTPGNYWGVPAGTTVPTLTIPHAVFVQAVDQITRTVTLTVETYDGATLIGTKTATMQVTLASSQKPTIGGISHSEATVSPDVATLIGAYVQSVTKLALALTSPAGIHGSTIVSRSISVGTQTLTADGTTPNAISVSGTVPITATVTDSRGRVSSVTTQNVTVLAWTPPQFAQTALVVRALSDGTTDEDDGTYLKVDPADFSVTSLVVASVEKNKVEYRLSYRLYGGGSYTVDGAGWIDPPNTPSVIRFTGTRLSTFGSAALGSAYEVLIEIRDVLATSSVVRVVPKAQVLMHWKASLGVAFGGRHSGAANPIEVWGRGRQASDGLTLADLIDLLDAASDAEAIAGTLTDKFVTPASLAAAILARTLPRNLIPNARGRVNQMGSTSGTSLALNAFFLDVWRSLTSTNAVTWTGSDDVGRVITVPSGEEVRAPVVERRDVIPDDYLLINYGTSQARVYNAGGSAPSLATASEASPLAVALDGTANVYVEFGPGTIDRPMLIRASEWSGYFPDTNYAEDLAWVQRFYQRIQSFAGGATAFAAGWMANSTTFSGIIPLITEMRATPTLSGTAAGSLQVRTGGTLTVSAYSIGASSSGRLVQMDATTSSGTAGDGGIFRATATGHYIELDARL